MTLEIMLISILLILLIGLLLATILLYFKAKNSTKAYHQALEDNKKLIEQSGNDRQVLLDSRYSIAEKSLSLLELKESLELEKEKSEKLLQNILPKKVINDLREKGESKPEHFADTTVFFSDIVNFTQICSTMSPEILIKELSDIFSNFDNIFVKNGCSRIKTIGDAYMAVSGLPDNDEKHCLNILNASLEAMKYLKERNKTNHLKWQMRFGINSGPVIAGIVGNERYIYDIFGDTVNVASRMEQHSEPMQINISESVKNMITEEYELEERPTVEVKGQGLMKMYFLKQQG